MPVYAPLSTRRSGFLDKLIVIAPLFMLGRVHEVFPALWPLRLVLVTTLLLLLTVLFNGGLGRSRLALFWHSRTFRWFTAFLGIMFFSVFFSIFKSQSFFYTTDFILYFGILLLALNCQINRKEDLRFSLTGISLTLFVMIVISYTAPRDVGGQVAANWSYDPNDTALFFVMILALILPAMNYIPRFYKLCLYALALMGGGVVILTQSRGGLIACVVTLAAWGMSRGVKGVLRFFVVLGVGFALVTWTVPADKLERFYSLFNLKEDYNLTEKHGRLDIWNNGIILFKDNWITGTGVSTFATAEGQINEGGKWSSAHNSFLQVAVELGLPGLFVFMGMLFSAFRLAKPRDDTDWLGRGIRLSLVSFLAGGMFLSWGYHIVLYFVLCIAMIRERLLALGDLAAQEAPTRERHSEPVATPFRKYRQTMSVAK
ncbi:O-antigen ligase family protein [Desulfonatronum thiodismutans]|uniref:O-antigen ligase family protein n=1 Tax=Desulfonatronum thiodismutans TaxID=159290 RepID=UPI0004ABDE07|nr:O-antigen ligase family protein [Desulfonatronum thiodismutans]